MGDTNKARVISRKQARKIIQKQENISHLAKALAPQSENFRSEKAKTSGDLNIYGLITAEELARKRDEVAKKAARETELKKQEERKRQERLERKKLRKEKRKKLQSQSRLSFVEDDEAGEEREVFSKKAKVPEVAVEHRNKMAAKNLKEKLAKGEHG